MAAAYTYHVLAWWTSGRTGLAKCDSAPNAIHFSEASELGGLEGRWTPEQLLLSALAACFTTTFEALARAAGFDYTDLEVEVEGIVRRGRMGCNFAEISIRPRLTVTGEEEFEAGLALLRKTKSVCMVSRSLTAPQMFEPRVEPARMPPLGWQDDRTAKLSL